MRFDGTTAIRRAGRGAELEASVPLVNPVLESVAARPDDPPGALEQLGPRRRRPRPMRACQVVTKIGRRIPENK
jgi:hypothetical protein